jgi:hypothetical protein
MAIETLTPAQRDKMRDYREESRKVLLCTEPADPLTAERAIRAIYTQARVAQPEHFIWFGSPMTGCFMAAMVQSLTNAKGEINPKTLWEQFGKLSDQLTLPPKMEESLLAQIQHLASNKVTVDKLRQTLRVQIASTAWASMVNETDFKLRHELQQDLLRTPLPNENIYESIRTKIHGLLTAKTVSAHRKMVSERLWNCSYGHIDAEWVNYYLFMGRELGIPACMELEHTFVAARHCGMWWAFSNGVIATSRPDFIKLDGGNRLHGENSAAIGYPDGFGVYAWHGHIFDVKDEWIIKDKAAVTLEKIMAEPNAELRRIMCEATEFAPLMQNTTLISQDVDCNGHTRRLLRVNVGNLNMNLLEVINGSLEPDGSRRKFVLGAMRNTTTPAEAVAASYGINPRAYKEALRT